MKAMSKKSNKAGSPALKYAFRQKQFSGAPPERMGQSLA